MVAWRCRLAFGVLVAAIHAHGDDVGDIASGSGPDESGSGDDDPPTETAIYVVLLSLAFAFLLIAAGGLCVCLAERRGSKLVTDTAAGPTSAPKPPPASMPAAYFRLDSTSSLDPSVRSASSRGV